jgi:hypothetical protein
MKSWLSCAALLAAVCISSPATAAPIACTGPFAHCAVEVQAMCTRDAKGQQRMTYWDYPGNTIAFERCVGTVFESTGRPNPYKTGISSSRGLSVPYTELLYPMFRDRP